MPSKTKSQQKLMCWALSYKRGKTTGVPKKVADLADSMTEEQLEDFCMAMEAIDISSFKNFLVNEQQLTPKQIKTGIKALSAYYGAEKQAIHIFASTPWERYYYKKIVDDLMKTGQYKKMKEKYISNGYVWVLKKRGIV
jgi:hypothetical protein